MVRLAGQTLPVPVGGLAAPAKFRWPGQRPRIALYSHDTMGLGHRRRSLLVAQALASSALEPVTLTIAGATDLGGPLSVPAGVDSIVLPALSKVAGEYQSRRLAISLRDLIAVRSATIAAALASFSPDLLIVDNVPRGAVGELDEALEMLWRRGRTRVVLGLRDILDAPEIVRAEWQKHRVEDAIRRYYDAVWVYADPAVYDAARQYAFAPDVRGKIRFTGYLDPRERIRASSPAADLRDRLGLPADRQVVLCLVGGGEDGGALVDAFIRTPLPPGMIGLVVSGPFMPEAVRADIRRRSEGRADLRVLDTHDDPARLVSVADRVVMMGGYNTTCEVMALERPALVVPRVWPRREQIIRAERLQELGVMDVLHPDGLTPGAIAAWLERPAVVPRVHGRIDMRGLSRVPLLAAAMLAARSGQRARGAR